MTSPGDDRCPFCRAALAAPDTAPIDSKKCPRCGAELWVLIGSGGPVFYVARPGQTKAAFVAALAAPLYGLSAQEMEQTLQRADSLDLVELVIKLEDQLPWRSLRPANGTSARGRARAAVGNRRTSAHGHGPVHRTGDSVSE